MEFSVVVVSIWNKFSSRLRWKRLGNIVRWNASHFLACLPCKSLFPNSFFLSFPARQHTSLRNVRQAAIIWQISYASRNWSNFRFKIHKKGFGGKRSEAQKFSRLKKNVISKRHKHQLHSTCLPWRFIFRSRLYDCHIFDRKKDIYFLLHLSVIFLPTLQSLPLRLSKAILLLYTCVRSRPRGLKE